MSFLGQAGERPSRTIWPWPAYRVRFTKRRAQRLRPGDKSGRCAVPPAPGPLGSAFLLGRCPHRGSNAHGPRDRGSPANEPPAHPGNSRGGNPAWPAPARLKGKCWNISRQQRKLTTLPPNHHPAITDATPSARYCTKLATGVITSIRRKLIASYRRHADHPSSCRLAGAAQASGRLALPRLSCRNHRFSKHFRRHL